MKYFWLLPIRNVKRHFETMQLVDSNQSIKLQITVQSCFYFCFFSCLVKHHNNSLHREFQTHRFTC